MIDPVKTDITNDSRSILNAFRIIPIIMYMLPILTAIDDSSATVIGTCAIPFKTITKLLIAYHTDDCIKVLEKYKEFIKSSDNPTPSLAYYAFLRNYDRCRNALNHLHNTSPTRNTRLVTNFWRSIGQELLPLPEMQVKIFTSFVEIDSQVCPPPWDICRFRRCICHLTKHCHTMKVCKGCWKVKYCCVKCQKA